MHVKVTLGACWGRRAGMCLRRVGHSNRDEARVLTSRATVPTHHASRLEKDSSLRDRFHTTFAPNNFVRAVVDSRTHFQRGSVSCISGSTTLADDAPLIARRDTY